MMRIAHGGMAGTDEPDVAAALVATLDAALRDREADVFVVPAVRTGSVLETTLFERLPRSRVFAAPPTVHRRMELPESYDAFLAGRDRKSRYNLRRQMTQLEERFGERAEMRVLDSRTPLDEVFAQLTEVAAKTYQHGLGAGFLDTPDRRAVVGVSLGRDAFRAWVLAVDGSPVAFWQGTVRGRTFVLNTAGYDPEFAQFGVGGYVQQQMFRDLCNDPEIDLVDFGWGDADYKARFGTEQWEEHDVVVYAPTLKGRKAAAIRRSVARAESLARSAAQRAGVLQKVKRLWRRRLSRRGR
jgi:CelD/BcsL family acetyltransferase involved in cellulose biosynthesis